MLELPRIPVERQRNVGRALTGALAHKRKPALDADVARLGHTVLTATDALAAATGPDAPTIDGATDSVLSAVWRILLAWERGGTDRVVTPAPDLRASLAAVKRLKATWFPDGIEFIHEKMAIEWDRLAQILATLPAATTRADVQLLGISPLVAHLGTHGALYMQALGAGGQAGASGPGDLWHQAYVGFAAAVLTKYPDDAETRTALTGRYDQELREHRTAQRASRRKARLKKAKPVA